MVFDFRSIEGAEDSKQENFSSLCSRLVMRVYPDAKPVDGKGGDEGLDTLLGEFNGKCKGFQHKYFTERVGNSQRRQIEESLKTAIARHQLEEWILLIPLDLNPSEIKWFGELSKKYAPLKIEWWGKTKLQDLLKVHSDIADDFERTPSIVNIFVQESINARELVSPKIVRKLKESIDVMENMSSPEDIVEKIARDFQSQMSKLKILIWGPGSGGGDLFKKRCEIRDSLNKLGHTAHFSEDIWKPAALASSGLNLSVGEYLQAKFYDYIICLMASPGAIGEVHDFAHEPLLSHKMMICVDKTHKTGYSAQGVLRIFEGNHGRLDWFQNPIDLTDCHLATRVLDQIAKVVEAKQWENRNFG